MKLIDLFLFGPPLLLVLIGWLALWYTKRESRLIRAQRARQGAAE